MAAAENINRRRFGQTLATGCLAIGGFHVAGCAPDATANDFGELDLVWSRQGLAPGRLQKPRAMAIDLQDRIYIVDFTARVQVFDPDGKFLFGWKTPASKDGRPTGISIDSDGTVMVADTHYYRVLFYTPEGKLLEERTIGGTVGSAPGEFGFVTDAVRAPDGSLFVSEYSLNDRIRKFAPDGKHLLQWGEPGSGPGEFRRPQSLLLDGQGRLVVSDSCNHRLQVFDQQGTHLATWANEGSQAGNCIILTASPRMRRETCMCASTAITACRSLEVRENPSALGAVKVDSPASCGTRGPWWWIVRGDCMCWIRGIIGCSELYCNQSAGCHCPACPAVGSGYSAPTAGQAGQWHPNGIDVTTDH